MYNNRSETLLFVVRLQDKATTIKHKINTLEQTTKAEAKRLTSEVIRLHNNIKDIEQKAEYFSRVNDTKYNQLWKFNYDTAKKLLDKVKIQICNMSVIVLFSLKQLLQ